MSNPLQLACVLSCILCLIVGFSHEAISPSLPKHKQHASLGVLVDLHEAVGEVIGTKGQSRILCGSLNVRAYQQLAAVRWAAEIINNNSWSNEFQLDVVVHDTCADSRIALIETHQLIKWSKENQKESPLIGVIVIGTRNNEKIIDKPLETLGKENISTIVTSPRAAELLLAKHLNVFTTAPDISSVTEAITSLLIQIASDSIAVISSCSHAVKKFEKIAATKSIPVKYYSIIQKDNPLILDAILQFFKGDAKTAKTVVMLLETSDLERLVKDKSHGDEFKKIVHKKSWILGSVAMDQELAKEWSEKFQSDLLLMQPHVTHNPDFHAFFLSNVKDAMMRDTTNEAKEYIEKIYHCQWPEAESSQLMRMKSTMSRTTPAAESCGNLSNTDLNENFYPDSDVGFIVSAVSAYSAALRLAQLDSCPEQNACDLRTLSGHVYAALRKLNFPIEATTENSNDADESTEPTVAASHELEGTRGRINYQGKIVSRKYDLLLSRPTREITQVGQYSNENGLLLDMTFGDLNFAGESDEEPESEVEQTTLVFDSIKNKRQGKHSKPGVSKDGPTNLEYLYDFESPANTRRLPAPELYISRVWAMVVVAVALTGVFLAMYVLVYVLLRMCDGTLNGNQALGIMLLLCIMVLFSTVVLFVLPPREDGLLCNLRVFVPSSALTIAFGILLLKAMQLRALVQLGLGGRISSLNQSITLLFIFFVQLSINLQWFFTPHSKDLNPKLMNECAHPHQTFLLLHSYVGLLILFVFLYGTSVLKIRRNYNEARWITLTSLLSIPIGIGWVLVVLIGPPEFQEPAASITFISIATVLLFSIFIPKLSTISRQNILAKRKKMLQQVPPGYTGSISTIFTTLSDRGTLQSNTKGSRFHNHYQPSTPHSTYYSPPPPPPMPSHGKSVTYSPRLTTNIHHSSSNATSLARSISMKSPLFESGRGAYP